MRMFCLPPAAPRIKPYLSLHAEAEAPDDLAVEEDEEAMPTETGKAIELENNLMMEALPGSFTQGPHSMFNTVQFILSLAVDYAFCNLVLHVGIVFLFLVSM